MFLRGGVRVEIRWGWDWEREKGDCKGWVGAWLLGFGGWWS